MGKVSQQDRRKQDRKRLEAATRQLMDSDGWRAWLEARSKFHSYSLGNQLLIAYQSPDATQVAGYKTWQKLGRQVRKGERGIRILAPCSSRKSQDCPDCGITMQGSGIVTCPKCGLSTHGRSVYFRSVSVFDISQTDGEPLAEIPRASLEGDSHSHYLPTLEAFARELGYVVKYDDTGSKGGWCDYSAREIVVSQDKSPNGQVRTLVHEIAHALGIGYDYGHDTAEVIVESVAYVVASSVGLDTSTETLAYVAAWSGRDDLETLKSYAGTIDDLAGKIETALGVGKDAGSRAA